MDGLDAEAYDRTYKDRDLVNRILRYFKPQGRLMLLVSATTLASSLLDAALPILISHGIDVYAANRSLEAIAVIVTVVLLAGGLSWTFNFVRQANTARAVGAVSPKPVNFLSTGIPVATVAAWGPRRISLGGALASLAFKAMLGAADEIASQGTFTAVSESKGPALNPIFSGG